MKRTIIYWIRMRITNPDKYKQEMKRFRAEHKEAYNNYMKQYMRNRRKQHA